MDNIIEELLNGYDVPVFLSDAEKGTISFSNKAFRYEMGFSEHEIKGMPLQKILQNERIIKAQTVLEHNDTQYRVQNENLTLSGKKYIKSILKPFSEGDELLYDNFQKELSRRIVHRLRSPLAGALGFTELLKDTPLNEKQLEYLSAVEGGLNDLEDVLKQLKTLAEPVKVHPTEVNTPLLAEQIIDALPKEQQRRVELVIDEEAETRRSDFMLLKLIIEEILHNAFEHGADNDSAVTLHFTPGFIRITNQGTPIPESFKKNIFFPFFSTKARNLGIGLAKCASYARYLGLQLRLAENHQETGVSFDIVFPDSFDG